MDGAVDGAIDGVTAGVTEFGDQFVGSRGFDGGDG